MWADLIWAHAAALNITVKGGKKEKEWNKSRYGERGGDGERVNKTDWPKGTLDAADFHDHKIGTYKNY